MSDNNKVKIEDESESIQNELIEKYLELGEDIFSMVKGVEVSIVFASISLVLSTIISNIQEDKRLESVEYFLDIFYNMLGGE